MRYRFGRSHLLQYALGMRRLLLALILVPMTAPVYADRNCTDHFSEDAGEPLGRITSHGDYDDET